jgi:glycosyltransferase involved in cell wall biosynthesis
MPTISIVTVCKGRLAHLKDSLPSFLAQPDCEVIVVDYDCPEGASEFVRENHPAAKVVKLENRPFFNNWNARNEGAKHATGKLLAFLDADVVLADGFAEWVSENIGPDNVGKMPSATSQTTHRDEKLSEASNKLEGVQVMHKSFFDKLGGYDDLLQGWGAGGDMDMVDRMGFHNGTLVTLPEELIAKGIQHSMDERTKFHQTKSTAHTHLVGILYRKSKLAMMRLFDKELDTDDRKRLLTMAENASKKRTAPNSTHIEMLVTSEETPGANYKIEQQLITRVILKDREAI